MVKIVCYLYIIILGSNMNDSVIKRVNKELFQILIIILSLYIIFNFLIISIRIDGSSMYPTLIDGERGIMLRTNVLNEPKKGDIIVFNGETNYDKHELIIKRIIGVGGDTVVIENNEVKVNNAPIDDSKRNPDTDMEDMQEITVPEGYYFVLGDNRNNSRDSREVGLIAKSDVIAVNGVIFWPLNKIKLMK